MKCFTAVVLISLSLSALSNNYYVTNANDSGVNSLRAAIDSATQNGTHDSIFLLLTVYDTIHLKSSIFINDNDSIVITGLPCQNPTISGDTLTPRTPAFYFVGENLTLNYLNIFNCHLEPPAYDGGIAVYANNLNLNYCFFYNNSVHRPFGITNGNGGVVSANSVDAKNCTFSNNQSTAYTPNLAKGGVAIICAIGYLSRCTFVNNSTGSNIIVGAGIELYLYDCRFSENHSGGGGIISWQSTKSCLRGNIFWDDSVSNACMLLGYYTGQTFNSGCNWFRNGVSSSCGYDMDSTDTLGLNPQFGTLGYYGDCVPTLPILDSNVIQEHNACFFDLPPIQANTYTYPRCGLPCSGGIVVHATSGLPPFQYHWTSSSSSNQILSNVCPGIYQVTITDYYGSTASYSITLNAVDTIVLWISANNVTSCANDNGTALVHMQTGFGPFTYLWNTGDTTAGLNNLGEGNYTVTVNDSHGCSGTASRFIYGNPLGASIIKTNTRCGEDNGSATAILVGDTIGAEYQWSNGDTSQSISNLASGSYTLTVVNGNCMRTTSTIINSSAPVVANIHAPKTELCAGDSMQLCLPFSFLNYVWNTGQTTRCITVIDSGTYNVTTTDLNNCTAVSNQLVIVEYPPTNVTITNHGTWLESSEAESYQWFLDGVPMFFATNQTVFTSGVGSYTVQVTDTNGCTAMSTPVVITGIENITEGDVVTVFPNPSTGNWQLQVGVNLLGGTAEVFDVNGRVVFTSVIGHRSSVISPDVPKGVYLLRVSSSKGSAVRKLVRM